MGSSGPEHHIGGWPTTITSVLASALAYVVASLAGATPLLLSSCLPKYAGVTKRYHVAHCALGCILLRKVLLP
jgi:hypothetical protein